MCLNNFVQDCSEVFAIKTEVYSADRPNEVNKGFIIWLCWIAIVVTL